MNKAKAGTDETKKPFASLKKCAVRIYRTQRGMIDPWERNGLPFA